jgi:hypothetical protein
MPADMLRGVTMVDFSNASTDPLPRSWLLLGALLVAHLLFILLLNPADISHTQATEWLHTIGIGAMFAQPILFASWAALGPPPAIKRIPLTSAAVLALMLVSGVKQWNLLESEEQNSLDVEWVFMGFAFFAAATLLMLLLRKLSRCQIVNARVAAAPAQINQFTMKQLLTWTTICALLLGAGRGLTSTQASSADWLDVISDLSAMIGLVLLAILPALVAPLVTLAPRPSVRILFAGAVAWLAVSWISIETVVAVENEPRGEVLQAVSLLQVGGMTAGVFSSIVVRYAGYRLLSASSSGGQSVP